MKECCPVNEFDRRRKILNPEIHIVVAMTRKGLIGSHGNLPWKLEEDLKLFRELTMGQTVIMGRKTFDSIGAPLCGRHNIVITSKPLMTEEVFPANSFEQGLEQARTYGQRIFFIGGRAIYKKALPLTDYLHISWVEGNYDGDTFFPDFDINQWQELQIREYDGFTHITYRRMQ